MFEEMPMMFYRLWYKNDVEPNLSKEQKIKILEKISDMSMRIPIYEPNTKIELFEIPELSQYTKLNQYTGLQLYSVMMEIYNEIRTEKTTK